jgi:hypothetical protein
MKNSDLKEIAQAVIDLIDRIENAIDEMKTEKPTKTKKPSKKKKKVEEVEESLDIEDDLDDLEEEDEIKDLEDQLEELLEEDEDTLKPEDLVKVKTALNKYSAREGREQTIKILKKFAPTVSQLKPAQVKPLMNALKV